MGARAEGQVARRRARRPGCSTARRVPERPSDESAAVYSAGMLVAIEGIDGAGKQTQTAALVRHAEAAGLRSASISFPRYGETFFARSVEELLRGESAETGSPRLVGLLFAGDRLESRSLLESVLATSDLVIADRYVASNLAYQAAHAPLDERAGVMEWLETVEHGIFALPRPALTVLLDVPVEVAAARLAARPASGGRPAGDRYEADRALLTAVRAAYLELATSRPGWVIVPVVGEDGPRSAAAVAGDVWAAVEPLCAGPGTPNAR